MIEQGKISNRQAMMLLVTIVLATGLWTFSAVATAEAKQDAWLSIIIAALAGLAVVLITVPLGWRFPGKTIVEYSEEILGKFLGKAVGLIYIWLFLHMAALVVREFGEFIIAVFMDDTPLVVFAVTILFAAALAIYGGLEVISRVNTMIFAVIIISLFTFLLLAAGEMDPARLQPFLAGGMQPVLKGSLAPAGWFGELVTIAFLIPYISRPKLAGRSAGTAVLILLVVLLIVVTASIMVFGAAQTGRMQFPTFMIARNISFLPIVERSEASFMLLWVGGILIKITTFYYIAALSAGQWCKLSSYRPLILPLGLIIGVLSFIDFRNNPELVSFTQKVWGVYALPVELGLPAVLLLIAIIRRKGARQKR